jgi:serine/threonine protein kinase
LKKFDDPALAQRFFNEGRIIASLNHPNIITIYDLGVVDERHYIAMEYLEGGDLTARIDGGVPAKDALELLETVGGCLDFVHRRGVIHRDIKPGNILFRNDGTPVLTDFGIAKQLEDSSTLTLAGTTMGTPCYLSPEQAQCKPLDGRADIYSLGIIFYEMLTGQRPFQGSSAIETIMAHITMPVPAFPSELKRYQSLLERMIAKTPDERFDSAAELVEYINALLRNAGLIGSAAEKLYELVRNARESGVLKSVKEKVSQHIERTDRTELVDWAAAAVANEARPTAQSVRKSFSVAPEIRWIALGVAFACVLAGGMLTYSNISEEKTGQRAEAASTAVPPPDNGSTGENPQRRTEEYLRLAKIAFDEHRFMAPTPGNANDYYQEVLRLDPYNARAREGLEQTAKAYAEEASRQRKQEKIDEYLRLAKRAQQDFRLTTPKRNNAHYYYREAIKLDSGNRQARKGIAEIANMYADMAEASLEQFHYADAETHLRHGLAIQPNNRRLLALKGQTNPVRDVPGRVFGKIKSLFN